MGTGGGDRERDDADATAADDDDFDDFDDIGCCCCCCCCSIRESVGRGSSSKPGTWLRRSKSKAPQRRAAAFGAIDAARNADAPSPTEEPAPAAMR